MQSLSWLTISLSLTWTLSLLYGEMLAFRFSRWSCSWPNSDSSHEGMDDGADVINRTNIAVLADPQLMDRTSLNLPANSFALKAAQFYTDIYMRRAFLASILPFNPDLFLFLGDQFDGGPFLSDDEWRACLYRFKQIFNQPGKEKNANKKVLYLSGNHDIGYAGFHSLYAKVIKRYEEEFGKRNYDFTIEGVNFVVVDAQTLDGHLQRNLTLESWEFIKRVSKDSTSSPKVLLSHIPLYRPNDTPCGQYRSSPIVNQRISRKGVDRGISYQNYLTEETSRRLLDLIKPVLVLSGHDHDQCTITHATASGTVTEHTLGTVSWQQGNLYPSFMLLSVVSSASSSFSSNKERAVYTKLCFLPMQTHIYIWYAVLFVVTLFLLASWPTGGIGFGQWMDIVRGAIASSFSIPKLKNDDEDCEYEMVWDAEGTMHLVSKVSRTTPRATTSDMGLLGRGNVIARTQARKVSSQEATDDSISVERNAADDAGRPRPRRATSVKAAQRAIRVIRLASIIAAANLPLYMMLLFKDGIEL